MLFLFPLGTIGSGSGEDVPGLTSNGFPASQKLISTCMDLSLHSTFALNVGSPIIVLFVYKVFFVHKVFYGLLPPRPVISVTMERATLREPFTCYTSVEVIIGLYVYKNREQRPPFCIRGGIIDGTAWCHQAAPAMMSQANAASTTPLLSF